MFKTGSDTDVLPNVGCTDLRDGDDGCRIATEGLRGEGIDCKDGKPWHLGSHTGGEKA